MNDLELVNAAVEGDMEAFQQLYNRGDKAIRQAVRKVLKGSEAGEDVIQDSWVRIWKKKHLFRGDAKFETWAYRVGWNCALEYIRASHAPSEDARVTVSIEVISQDSHWEPEDVRMTPQLLDEEIDLTVKMYELINALRGRYKQCVELRLQGLMISEVAQQLGISSGAVKSYLYRAIGMLQEYSGLPAPGLDRFRAQTRDAGFRVREKARAAKV